MTPEPNEQQQSLHQATQEIAAALGETERMPIAKIARIITTIGAEATRALLAETQAIEARGGMLTANGKRRKTSGGVFFRLARDRLDPAQRVQIFGLPQWARKKPHPPSAATPPASPAPTAPTTPPATWADRGTRIQEAVSQPGKVHTVKVTLIGRPGKIVAQPDFTLLLMKHNGPLPALPKGIPVPQTIPETSYIVYVGAKQWRGVAEAIKREDDALIIEGTQIYDQEHGAIAVFATNVTTKALQQAKRQAPQSGT